MKNKVPSHLRHFLVELKPYKEIIISALVAKNKSPLPTLAENIVQFVSVYDNQEIEDGEFLVEKANDFVEKLGYYVNSLNSENDNIAPAVVTAILGFLGGNQTQQVQKTFDTETILLIVAGLAVLIIVVVKI